MDEKPYQLLGETREPIPMKANSTKKVDSEYVRNGECPAKCVNTRNCLNNIRASDSLASLLFKEFLEKSKSKTLTLRERDVADLLRQGLSNKEISDRLFLSLYTVKCHVSSILKKQKLTNRYQLLRKNEKPE
jgi:DNA-binding NarL/FixJ family response regulator